MNKYKRKINKIRKYFRKDSLYLELMFIEYNDLSLYIAIYYNNKDKCYKLYWFDLNELKTTNITKYLNMVNINKDDIKKLNYFYKYSRMIYKDISTSDIDKVILNTNIKNEDDILIKTAFNTRMNDECAGLQKIFNVVFTYLPTMFYPIIEKLYSSEPIVQKEKKEYRNFKFDLLNGDLNKIFKEIITIRGNEYYEENKVNFLEKDNDKYYAFVEGNEGNYYLVTIKYNEKTQRVRVHCDCPCDFNCKHLYAVILAIRNKKFNSFYHVTFTNINKNHKKYYKLFDKNIEIKNDYLLCSGIDSYDDEFITCINEKDELVDIPIVDEYLRCQVKVLKDKKESLKEEIKDILKYWN